jgi:hypothetical protein
VSVDVDEVLNALRRDDLDLLVGGQPTPIPPWIGWLIWLGQWMRAQTSLPGRRIAVVRMPSRRLGAAFAAIGCAFAAARLRDDSLDWEGLRALAPGTKVSWREPASGKTARRSGTVAGLRRIGGGDFMEVVVEAQSKKAQQGTRLFAKPAALSYGVTLGSVSAVADGRLACAEHVIRAAVKDGAQGWTRSPGIECSIITERSSFLSDLEGVAIRVAGRAEAFCSDVLAIAEPGGRSHGKTMVAPARTDGVLDESGSVTILDGASATLRLSDTVARSVVVLLDQAEYDEEIEQLFQTFLGYAVDAHVHPPAGGVNAPPESVESFIFGLPEQSRVNA